MSVVSVMSIVSIMRGPYLITHSLNIIINRSNQNVSFCAMRVGSVVRVMSMVCVMRGLYLTIQSRN